MGLIILDELVFRFGHDPTIEELLTPAIIDILVQSLTAQAAALKEALAESVMENRLLKKSVLGDGGAGRFKASLYRFARCKYPQCNVYR